MTFDEAVETCAKGILRRTGRDETNARRYPAVQERAKDIAASVEALGLIEISKDDPRDNPPPQSR